MEIKSKEKEVEYKTVFEEDGSVRFIKKSEEKKGRKSRSSGGQFELRVRKDLEEKGYFVDKWNNNFDLDSSRVVPAKRVFKRFAANKGVMTIGTGFPDFIAFQKMNENKKISDSKNLPTIVADDSAYNDLNDEKNAKKNINRYKIIGVEVKVGGKLDRIEKEKCKLLLEREVFSEIWIAKKVKEKNKVRVEYIDFLEIEKRMR